MHISESILHIPRGEEANIPDAERCKDVCLEVLVEREARYALDQHTGPVDVDPVLELGAWLVDQGQSQHVVRVAGEFVKADGQRVVAQTGVIERVAEAGCLTVSWLNRN